MNSLAGKAIRKLGRPFYRFLSRYFVTRNELELRLARIQQQTEDSVRASRSTITIVEPSEELVQIQRNLLRLESDLGKLSSDASLCTEAIHDLARSNLSNFPHRSGESVGIIVTSCDRIDLLRSALTSLVSQTQLPNQVIVVNDGVCSVDDVISDFSSRLNLQLLRTPNPRSGPSLARNLGLDALKTELVAFLDDDNLMWPTWIENASKIFGYKRNIEVLYAAQLRAKSSGYHWFFEPFDWQKLNDTNFIDLNQLFHRVSRVRFDLNLKRLNDWDYVLRLIGDRPDRVFATKRLSSLYADDQLIERISIPDWPPDLLEVTRKYIRQEDTSRAASQTCNTCGYEGEFLPGPNGRPGASCPNCGSLERQRFLGLLSQSIRQYFVSSLDEASPITLLEIAPSPSTARFRRIFDRSISLDYDPQADGRTVDLVGSLTQLPLPNESIDVLVALHVLEHIPDDNKAMQEISRVLTSEGIAILQVPLSSSPHTDEEILETPEERRVRYGQADHVRIYGVDFFERLKKASLSWITLAPEEIMADYSIKKYGLIATEALVLAVKSDAPNSIGHLERFAAALRRGRWQLQGLGQTLGH